MPYRPDTLEDLLFELSPLRQVWITLYDDDGVIGLTLGVRGGTEEGFAYDDLLLIQCRAPLDRSLIQDLIAALYA